MSRSRGSGRGCAGRRECGGGLAHRGAEHARQLADLAWQPDLKDALRSVATAYDEIVEDIERGATEIRHPELLDK